MPENVTTSAVPLRCEPLTVEQQGDGFYAVLAGAAGRVLVTNNVGRLVLDLCDGVRDTEQITTEVVGRFPKMPADRVAGDVGTFMDAAVAKEVLTWQK